MDEESAVMERPLAPVDAGDAASVIEAVRSALRGDGPAVFPVGAEPASAPAPTSPPPASVPERVALVVQTSGSTARPKRVALAAEALLASARASDEALGGPGRWLLALPLTYIAGLNVVVRSIVAGADPVLMTPGSFDEVRFLEGTERMGGGRRYTSLVPVQLTRLIDAADPASSQLQERDVDRLLQALRRFDRILVGGQATPRRLLERTEAMGIRVTRTYGSSETSGGCVYDGRAIGDARMRVRDGEIQVAGSMLADGYLGDEERTGRAFVIDDDGRWYRTGDGGSIVDGVLRVTGRLDDVIISGGLKIALHEVEQVVRSMSGSAEVVVVPAASARWGEVPVVVTDAPLELDAVRSAVEARLGAAAAPSRIVVVERMPRLPNGKADRLALRALAASAS